jgi:hypothetical protein
MIMRIAVAIHQMNSNEELRLPRPAICCMNSIKALLGAPIFPKQNEKNDDAARRI